MNQSLLLLMGLAFIGSVAGLLGGVLFLIKKQWSEKLSLIAIPLAAGVLLALSFLDLLPEAVEASGNAAFTVVLVVFIILFFVERFLLDLHHHDHGSRHTHESTTPTVIFGDTIHNFIDGVAIGAAFVVNPTLGLITALSTFIHETPHEIADFGILIANGFSRKKTFMTNLLSSLATFPGAFAVYFFAARVELVLGIFLAVAAGAFLYVATTDFLPEVTHSHRGSFKQSFFLLVGILIIVLMRVLLPELH
jgi:zinc and cadmium transporter